MAELGGGGEQFGRLVAVGGPARPARRNMASANIASRSPRSAASRYHSAAFLSSRGDAEAVGVKLAEQRHRLDVALFLDPLGREHEGGEIMAALERAVGDDRARGPLLRRRSARLADCLAARARGAGLCAATGLAGGGVSGAGFGGGRAAPVSAPRRRGAGGGELERRARPQAAIGGDERRASGARAGRSCRCAFMRTASGASAARRRQRAAAGPRASRKCNRRAATKSAPAAASSPTSSASPAKPTQGHLEHLGPPGDALEPPPRTTAGARPHRARRT